MSDDNEIKKDTASESSDVVPKEMEVLKKAKKTMISIIIGVAVLIVVGVGVGGYWLVYQQTSDSSIRSWLINSLPLPVAMVNGSSVSYEQFEKNVEATEYFFSQQEELGLGLVEQPEPGQLRTDELERMIEQKLVEEIAVEYEVTVTDEEVDTYFEEQIIPQAPGGLDEVTETLSSLYNWSVDEFKQNVLHEVVLGTKLSQAIVDSGSTDESAIADEATQLYNEIIGSDRPFGEFATEHSDDPGSAANGGSLGSFGRGTMVPEFEEAAFALEVGGISEPVRTQFGYHIIHVTAKDTEADTVEAEHILLGAPTIEDMIFDKKETASITRLLPE